MRKYKDNKFLPHVGTNHTETKNIVDTMIYDSQLFKDVRTKEILKILNGVTVKDDYANWYSVRHAILVYEYAKIINNKLGDPIELSDIEISTISHDLLKEKNYKTYTGDKLNTYNSLFGNITIPLNLPDYLDNNIATINIIGINDYKNTILSDHGLAAAILLYNEMGITNTSIIHAVMFHNAPIKSIYKKLSLYDQQLIDIIQLADKLSSTYIKINAVDNSKVLCDLDLVLFGASGDEFNYSLALLFARIMSIGNKSDPHDDPMAKLYYERVVSQNPLVSKNYSIKRVGGKQIWPKRKSKHVTMKL